MVVVVIVFGLVGVVVDLAVAVVAVVVVDDSMIYLVLTFSQL